MNACMEGMSRRRGRRDSVIERLEDRSLLSEVSLSVVSRLSVVERSQMATLIEVRWVNEKKKVHSPMTRAVRNDLIHEPVANAKVSGYATDLTFVDWADMPRANLVASTLVSGNGSGGGAEDVVDVGDGGGSDAGLDTLSDLFLTEWESNSQISKGRTYSSRAGLTLSLYGQTGDEGLLTAALRRAFVSLATTSVMLINGHGAGLKALDRTSPGAQAGARLLPDGSVPAPLGQTGTASRVTRQEMAALLDGVGSLEWERLEHDLERFLSRISGLPTASVGPENDPVVPTLVAIFMVSLVAREAARRERWWRQRFVPGVRLAGGAPDDSTDPIGPWPLGLP